MSHEIFRDETQIEIYRLKYQTKQENYSKIVYNSCNV